MIIQSSDDGFGKHDGRKAWDKEPVEPVLGEMDSGEHLREHMPGNDEGCADAGSLVLVIELITERLVERNERRLGGVVVG